MTEIAVGQKVFWKVEARKDEHEVFVVQYPSRKEAVNVFLALKWALGASE